MTVPPEALWPGAAWPLVVFLATDPRLRACSPEATTVLLRVLHAMEQFGRSHPGAKGEDWPSDRMLPRICGIDPETFQRCRAELGAAGLWHELAGGGFDLGPIP